MKRFLLATLMSGVVVFGFGVVGCGGSHHHDDDPTAETAGGAYTCPRHGGSYDSSEDHCKVCKKHVHEK